MVIQKSGFSIPDFAKKLGVVGSTLVNYRDGRTSPTIDLLMKICEEFSVNPAWLLLEEGSMRPGDETPEPAAYVSPLDKELLQLILSTIKRRQALRGTSMSPDKEAELISLLYDYYSQLKTKPDDQSVERFLRLAV